MLTSILNEKATKVLSSTPKPKTIMPCGIVSSKDNVIIDTYLRYYSFDENENYYTSNDKQFLRYINKVKTELENILMSYTDCKYSVKSGSQKYAGFKGFVIMHLDIALSTNYSLSVYRKFNDVKRFLTMTSKYNVPYTIAKGTTNPIYGICLETKEWKKYLNNKKYKSSHVDWWLYDGANPYLEFEVINYDDTKCF